MDTGQRASLIEQIRNDMDIPFQIPHRIVGNQDDFRKNGVERIENPVENALSRDVEKCLFFSRKILPLRRHRV